MKKLNNRIENRVSMYKVVLFLCEQYPALMGMFSAINNLYMLFKQKVNEIDSLIQQKLLITTGLSVDKKNLKKQLAELAERIAGAVHAYADSISDNTLMHEVSYTSAKLVHMRDTAMADVCRNIYNKGVANAANIAGFGADAVMLQTFDTSIGLFENKSPQPTEAREHGAMLTEAIDNKETEIRNFLKNRFDKAIRMLTANDPNFVTDYFNSRKIYDIGMRRRKPPEKVEEMANMTGNITDADGVPLEDVIVELAGENETIVTETDEDGDYVHEAIPSGKYKLTVKFYGYKPITEVLEFNTNDEVGKDYSMEKDALVNPE